MNFQEYIFNLKLRIAALEAQKKSAETELAYLKEIKCPVCQGIGSIPRNSESEPGTIYQERCTICDGIGRACGAERY